MSQTLVDLGALESIRNQKCKTPQDTGKRRLQRSVRPRTISKLDGALDG
eukprot:COSAG06_NODE_38808_length_419_cov_1.450000_1_plen_48_part_10